MSKSDEPQKREAREGGGKDGKKPGRKAAQGDKAKAASGGKSGSTVWTKLAAIGKTRRTNTSGIAGLVAEAVDNQVRMLHPHEASRDIAKVLMHPEHARDAQMLRTLTEAGRYLRLGNRAVCSPKDRRMCALWHMVLQRLRVMRLPAQGLLVQRGQTALGCFWVLEGELILETAAPEQLSVAGRWACICPEALEGHPSCHTIRTFRPASLAYITLLDWQRCLERSRAVPFESLRLRQILLTHVKLRDEAAMSELQQVLSQYQVFQGFEKAAMLELCKQTEVVIAPRGTLVGVKNEPSKFFFLVLAGQLLLVDQPLKLGAQQRVLEGLKMDPIRAVSRDLLVSQGETYAMPPGFEKVPVEKQQFGHSAVVASREASLLLLSKRVYLRLLKQNNTERVEKCFTQLKSHPMFQVVPQRQLMAAVYSSSCAERAFAQGTALFHAGERLSSILIILEGEVLMRTDCELPDEAGPRSESLGVALVQAGRFVGCASLLGEPEPLAGIAKGCVRVMAVQIAALEGILGPQGMDGVKVEAQTALHSLSLRAQQLVCRRQAMIRDHTLACQGAMPGIRDNNLCQDVFLEDPDACPFGPGSDPLPYERLREAKPPDAAERDVDVPPALPAQRKSASRQSMQPLPACSSVESFAASTIASDWDLLSFPSFPSLPPMPALEEPLPGDKHCPPTAAALLADQAMLRKPRHGRSKLLVEASLPALLPSENRVAFEYSVPVRGLVTAGGMKSCGERTRDQTGNCGWSSSDPSPRENAGSMLQKGTSLSPRDHVPDAPRFPCVDVRPPTSSALTARERRKTKRCLVLQAPTSAAMKKDTHGRSALLLSCRTAGPDQLELRGVRLVRGSGTIAGSFHDDESDEAESSLVAIMSLPDLRVGEPSTRRRKKLEQQPSESRSRCAASRVRASDPGEADDKPGSKLRGINLFRQKVRVITQSQHFMGSAEPTLPLEIDPQAPRVQTSMGAPSMEDIHYVLCRWHDRWQQERMAAKELLDEPNPPPRPLQVHQRGIDDLGRFGHPAEPPRPSPGDSGVSTKAS